MANGRSPMPTSGAAPSSMPVMPSPSTATGQTTLLQPHEHHLYRASFETLTSTTSSNQTSSSTKLRRPALRSYYSDTSEYTSSHATDPRPHQILRHHHNYSSSASSLAPLRDLPPLLTSHAAVHWQPPVVEADQFLEGPADSDDVDAELILAGLDLSLGRLYGFPYCMGVPDAMEQRSRAVAEAEEAEYQKERKQKARLSARVSSTVLSWARRGQR